VTYGEGVKVVVSPGGIVQNTVYEMVDVDGTVQYAIKTTKKCWTAPTLELGAGVVYKPLVPAPWILPPPPKDYGSHESLWKAVRDYAYEHIDFEEEIQYDVYTAWIMSTWTVERWDSVSYLWFTGPPSSGKTRCLDVLAQLVFRPLQSPSVSASSIYRALDALHPTFLLDEFEMYEKMKEAKSEVIGVLNAGYRRGQVVLRTDKVKDGVPVLRGFNCFGPKALASIEDLPPALQNRTIPFIMSRAARSVRRTVDREKAKELRAMLLKFRFDSVLEPLPENLNPIDLPDGRLIELFTPLVLSAPREAEKNILEYATKLYVKNLEAERDTEEAKVYVSLLELLENEPRLLIPQAEVRDKVNEGLPEKSPERLGKKTVSRALSKGLGLPSKRNRKTKLMEVIILPEKLERRVQRYLLPEDWEWAKAIIEKVKQLKVQQQLPTKEDELERNMCEKCGVELGVKLHMVPGKGEMWLCEKCFKELSGN